MIEADFEGGSVDDVEDAIKQLDEAGRPYLMYFLSTMSVGRLVVNLTPNSKELFRNMYEDGVLNAMLEDILYREDE